MWSVGPETWDLYLGTDRSAMRCTALPEMSAWEAHEDLVEAVYHRLTLAKAKHRRKRVHIWLSSAWARPYVLRKIDGVVGIRELRTLAEAQATESAGFGDGADVWLEPYQAPFLPLAVAMPGMLAQRLHEVVEKAGGEIVSLRPWWAGALDCVLDKAPAASPDQGLRRSFLSSDTDGFVLLCSQGNDWTQASVSVGVPSRELARAQVARRLFSAEAEASQLLHATLSLNPGTASTRLWPPAQIGVALEAW